MRLEGFDNLKLVKMDGVPLDPCHSQEVFNHSPDGFNWGYAGSGPAQLALAILLAAKVSERRAVRLHQLLKRDLIQSLPHGDSFDVEFDLDAWIAAHPVKE